MGGCSGKPSFVEWKRKNKGNPYSYMKDVYFDDPSKTTLAYREFK